MLDKVIAIVGNILAAALFLGFVAAVALIRYDESKHEQAQGKHEDEGRAL